MVPHHCQSLSLFIVSSCFILFHLALLLKSVAETDHVHSVQENSLGSCNTHVKVSGAFEQQTLPSSKYGKHWKTHVCRWIYLRNRYPKLVWFVCWRCTQWLGPSPWFSQNGLTRKSAKKSFYQRFLFKLITAFKKIILYFAVNKPTL